MNKLIREGATPVFSSWDILEKYAYLYPHRIRELQDAEVTYVPEKRSSKRVRFLGKAPRKALPKEQKQTLAEPPEIDIAREQAPNPAAEGLSGNEKIVYEALKYGVETFPDQMTETGLPAQEILATLTMLEIQGLCEKTGGGYIKK